MVFLFFVTLSLLSTLSLATTINDEVFKDFRLVALFLNEPMMKSLTVGDYKLIDENYMRLAGKFSEVLAKISQTEQMKEYKELAESINEGIDFQTEIDKLATMKPSLWDKPLRDLNQKLLDKIETGKEFFIPSGWTSNYDNSMLAGAGRYLLGGIMEKEKPEESIDRGIGLSIQRNTDSKKFDLRIFNLGEGMYEFHEGGPDPKNLYLILKKPWKTYKGIPITILSDSPWLIYVLTVMKSVYINRPNAKLMFQYFYEEVLAQLQEYWQEKDYGKDGKLELFVPSEAGSFRRVGSLMGRLAWSSSSKEEFETLRLRMCLQLVDDWMKKYINTDDAKKSNQDLISMIQSFQLIRKVTQYFTTSLANMAISTIKNAQDGFLTSSALLQVKHDHITDKQYELLSETADVCRKLLHFVKEFPLSADVFTISKTPVLNPSISRFYMGFYEVEFSSFDLSFLKKNGGSLYAKENPCLFVPIEAKTSHDILNLLRITADKNCEQYLAPNLMSISKSLKLDTIKLIERDYYKWMKYYYIILSKFNKPKVDYIDLFLPFFKISYLSWKFVQALDAKNGNYMLDLAQFASPLRKVCLGDLTAKIQNYRTVKNKEITRNAIALSDDFDTKLAEVCNLIEKLDEEKEHEFLGQSKLGDQQSFAVDQPFLDENEKRPEYKIFQKIMAEPEVEMYERRHRLQANPDWTVRWGVLARDVPSLTVKYRPFFDAISLWGISNHFFNLQIQFDFLASFSSVPTGFFIPPIFSSGIVTNRMVSTPPLIPKNPLITVLSLKAYSRRVADNLLNFENGEGVEQVLNIFDSAIDVSVMDHLDAVAALDFVLFTSRRMWKKMEIRETFAMELINSMSKLFDHVSMKAKIKVYTQDESHSHTSQELDGLLEFSILFLRALKSISFKTDEHNGVIFNLFKDIYDYWYGFVRLDQPRIQKFIISDDQYARINFFLAYQLFFLKNVQEFATHFGEDYIPRFFSHHFVGEFGYKVGERFLLDAIYHSKVVIGWSLELLKGDTKFNMDAVHSKFEKYLMDIIAGSVKVVPVKGVKSSTIVKYAITMDSGTTINLECYLPTVEIINNGAQFFTASKITNDKRFLDFFKDDLQVALSGKFIVAPNGVNYAFVVSNYQVQGSQYACVIQNDVLSIYRLVEGEWWILAPDPEGIRHYSLGYRFGMYDAMGLDLYFHSSDTKMIMWMAPKTNEYMYKVTPLGLVSYGLYVKGLTDKQTLPFYTIPTTSLPWPLQQFLQKIPFTVLKRSKDEYILLVQLLGFRNSDGTKSPLAISVKGSVYTILNHNNMVLADLQLFKDDNTLNGLIVNIKESETSKSQLYLMAEYSPYEIRNYDGLMIVQRGMYGKPRLETSQYKPAYLNLVPMHAGHLQPSVRSDRIVSAYHACASLNFKMGMDWVGQDGISRVEPFDNKEEKMIEKFIDEADEVPESTAVKLALGVQSALTGKVLNASKLKQLLISYMNAVPDMSDKFHFHLNFPEILEPKIISLVFGNLDQGGVGWNTIARERKMIASRNEPYDNNAQDYKNGYFKIIKIEELENIGNYQIFSPNLGINFETLMDLYNKYKNNELSAEKLTSIMSIIARSRYPLQKSDRITACRCLYFELETIKLEKFTNVEEFHAEIIDKCSEFHKISPRRQAASKTTNALAIFSNYKKAYGEKFEASKRQVHVPDYLRGIELVQKDDISKFEEFSNVISGLYESNIDTSISCSLTLKSQVFKELCESITKSAADAAFKSDTELLSLIIPSTLEDFIKFLTGRLQALEKEKHDLKETLKVKGAEGSKEKLSTLRSLFKIFHGKKEKDFDNLKRCYFSNSLQCFAKKFPNFSGQNDKLQELHTMSFNYYGTENLMRYYEAVKDLTAKIVKMVNEKQKIDLGIAVKALQDELLKITKMNLRLKIPGMLAYEYSSKTIRLRHEQFNDANELLQETDPTNQKTEGPFKSIVIQRMMAAGKTMVLGTIASVLKANGNALSILVPPASLYQSNAVSMQERTLKFFKVRGKTIHFQRFSLKADKIGETVSRLRVILHELKVALGSESYFIANPTELSAFHNIFVETMLTYQDEYAKGILQNERDFIFCLNLMRDIYRLFRDKSSIILDEIDMTMASSLELNYPSQAKEKINMSAAVLTADLILYTAYTDALKLGVLSNEQNNFDWSCNGQLIKTAWIDYVIEQLSLPESLWSKILYPKVVRGAHGFDMKTVLKEIRYVLETPKDKFVESMWLSNLKKISFNTFHALLAIRMQINNWIPESMGVAAFERYGPSMKNWKSIKYAIPYAAAKTPNEGSVFADRWETLNKSLIMYLLKKFSRREVDSAILAAIEVAGKGDVQADLVRNSFKECFDAPLENVRVIMGKLEINDNNNKPIDLQAIFQKKKIERCANVLKLNYVIKRIFENLEFNIEQITSNSLNMASLFKSVQGYSGTIDNINILPLQLVSQAYEQRQENEKNNGAIARKLLKQDQSTVSVVKIASSMKVGAMLESMFSDIKDVKEKNEFNAIIDVGAFFKSFRNFEVARAALEFSDKEVAIFYDEPSNQLHYVKKPDFKDVLLGSSDPVSISMITGASVEKRFTFYDQRHITGSDILQKPGAKALLTIGPKVLLRDILQGTMRLRQFMTTQSVHFVLTESVAELLRNRVNLAKDAAITIESILMLASTNEDEKQARENIRLAFSKIDDVIRTEALEMLQEYITKNCFEQLINSVAVIRPLFVRTNNEQPESWIKQIVDKETGEVLRMYRESRLAIFEKAFSEPSSSRFSISMINPFTSSETSAFGITLNNLKKKLEKLCEPVTKGSVKKNEQLRHYLPEMLPVLASGEGHFEDPGVELRLEVQVEVQVDYELEQILVMKDNYPRPRNYYLSAHQLENQLLREKSPLVILNIDEADAYINYGKNFITSEVRKVFSDFEFTTDLLSPSFSSETHLVDRMSQDGIAMAFVSHSSKWLLVLLSSSAVSSFFKELDSESRTPINAKTKIWITDLSGRSLRSSYPAPDLYNDKLFNSEAVQRAYFHLLLVNLSFDHIFSNSRLREQFARWLRSYKAKDQNLVQELTKLKPELRFLIQRFAGFGKDKFMYAKHPFFKLLLTAVSGKAEALLELQQMFPDPKDGDSKYLESIKFSPNLDENIWKYVPNKKDYIAAADDSENPEENNENDEQTSQTKTLDPFAIGYVVKSWYRIFYSWYFLAAYAVIACVVAFFIYRIRANAVSNEVGPENTAESCDAALTEDQNESSPHEDEYIENDENHVQGNRNDENRNEHDSN